MRRNEHFDFDRRESRFDQDHIDTGYYRLPFFWTSELASADGAHYHVWLDRRLSKAELETQFNLFKKAARDKGDPVSFSFDFLP